MISLALNNTGSLCNDKPIGLTTSDLHLPTALSEFEVSLIDCCSSLRKPATNSCVVSITLFAFILFSFLSVSPVIAESNLYPDERVEELAGFPAMVRFFKGNLEKPLLVLVPGSFHLARIFYGYPAGRQEDFLAYWLQNKGYNVLAVSYPIMMANPTVFDKVSGNFARDDWANQIALAAKQAVKDNNLTSSVVLVHWSAAGSIVDRATQACRNLGLNVRNAISLVATPPVPRVLSSQGMTVINGFIHRENYTSWLDMLKVDADENGRTVIPPYTYLNEFVGDMTFNLGSAGETYRDGKLTKDPIDIQHSFPTDGYPLVAVLQDDLPSDSLHAIGDASWWEFFNGRTVSRLGSRVADKLPIEKWKALVQLSRNMEGRLDFPVGGNHFFFVGEIGAKKTAEAIDRSIAAVDVFKKEWSAISGQAFE